MRIKNTKQKIRSVSRSQKRSDTQDSTYTTKPQLVFDITPI